MADEPGQEADDLFKVATLHKHWVAADSINYHLRRSTRSTEPQATGLPEELDAFGMQASMFMALGVWYALLYVVIEGYQELGYRDDVIDALLANEAMTDAFRRFRNATFHFQKNPISPKLLDFLTTADSETWVHDVNLAFRNFFEKRGRIREWIDAQDAARGGQD